MIFFRSLFFNVMLSLSGIIYGIVCLAFWLLPPRKRFYCVMLWVRFFNRLLRFSCNVRVKVVDHNASPVEGPVVVMANHQSTWETLFLQNHFQPISTIFKRSLLHIPFFGWGLALLWPIAIDRSSPLKALKRVKAMGKQRIRGGYSVLVFPEGTRMPVGQTGPFARSGADIAKGAGVPVIPVAHNAGECWPARQPLRFPGEITLVIGQPITTDDKSTREITEAVKNWIEKEKAALPPARDNAQSVVA